MGFTMASGMIGGLDRDAGCGDGREDPAGVFRSGQDDQGDLPRAEGVAEGGAQGAAVGGDGVPATSARSSRCRGSGRGRTTLDRLLAANEAKPARERLTLIRIFEELRGLGYEGGYDAVRRYARGWQRERAATSAAPSCR